MSHMNRYLFFQVLKLPLFLQDLILSVLQCSQMAYTSRWKKSYMEMLSALVAVA